MNYNNFGSNNDIKECNIAATILKIQERKTSKGNSYAIIKLTDLSGVFEIFIFSELLELNRSILLEGNSLLFTLNKSLNIVENRFKGINVIKLVAIKDLLNKPISEAEFILKDLNQIKKISNILQENGETNVKIKILDEKGNLVFNLKKKRKIERSSLTRLENEDISSIIS